jgi:multidrug/hemolysin transport system ATP-binding protein
MIKVKQLIKRYGELEAVKGISFDVKKGSFFAFLGPNGAGKSTTINIICTLLSKNEGEVFVNGFPLGQNDDAIRRSLGVVFQHAMLDRKLTVRQNLEVRGSFYGFRKSEIMDKINTLQTLLHIDYLDQPYGSLSGGQKRRADIARALIHEPELLILDEPTTGLDPKTRKDVWEVIETLRKQNMTIFLTTHYMEEAAMASHVVVINHGEIAASGTPDELKKAYAKDRLRLAGQHEVIQTYLNNQGLDYEMKEEVFEVPMSSLKAIEIIQDLKASLTGFEMIQATMDDVFLDIIQGGDLS